MEFGMSSNQPVAIVTGAGRGIGRATALELASRGYRLVLVARNLDGLNETSNLVGGALVLAGDVSHNDEVEQVVRNTLSHFGRIDALVNNAGHAPVRSVEQMTIAEWQVTIDTNLSSIFYFTRLVWPMFKRLGGGVIVNISSLAGRDPLPGFWAYGAAKAAINLMGLGLAREGAPHNIRVHTVAPGAVETQMMRSVLSHEQLPPEQALDPSDVAKVIGQCVSGDLKYTSGEVIYVHKTVG